MKETPPVLTAGPEAWIGGRGRKRWLVGTAPRQGPRVGRRSSETGAGRVHAPHPRVRSALPAIANVRVSLPLKNCSRGSPLPRELALHGQARAPCAASCMRTVVAQGLWDSGSFPGTADLAMTLLKFTRPAARSLHRHPHTGNIRSHLSRRGVACTTFGDTRGTGWSQPHLDAFLKLRPRVGGFC